MFQWIRKSVKNKIMIVVMAIIFILGAMTIAITFLSNKDLLISKEQESLKSLAAEESYIADRNIDTYVTTTKILSVQPSLVSYLDNPTHAEEGEMMRLLEKQNIGGMFDQISILKPDGMVSVSTDRSLVEADYSKYTFYKRAILGEQAMDYMADFQKNEVTYYVFSPVRKPNGEKIGIVVGQLSQESLFQGLVASELLANGANLMISDSNGLVIYSNDHNRVLKSIGSLTALDRENIAKYSIGEVTDTEGLQYDAIKENIEVYKGPANHFIIDNKEEEKEILAISKMVSAPLYIILEERESDIVGPALGKTAPIAGFAILAVIFSAIYISYFIKRILRPLGILKKVMESIGRGHLDQDVNIRTVDDFRELGDAVVLMTLELKEREKINKIRNEKSQKH